MIRILLVEDDAAIVRTLSDYLESEGFSVAHASAEAAAKAASTCSPTASSS